MKVSAGSHGNQNRHRKSPRTSYLWEIRQLFKAGHTGTVSILKKTLREFDSITDCLEQVRNDVKVTNEKLSALNTNSKSARPKTKENEIVKHGNAEKSKKRKEKRVSNRTWDTVVMVMNEKGILGITTGNPYSMCV